MDLSFSSPVIAVSSFCGFLKAAIFASAFAAFARNSVNSDRRMPISVRSLSRSACATPPSRGGPPYHTARERHASALFPRLTGGARIPHSRYDRMQIILAVVIDGDGHISSSANLPSKEVTSVLRSYPCAPGTRINIIIGLTCREVPSVGSVISYDSPLVINTGHDRSMDLSR